LGVVLRAPVAAVGAGVAYALPVESILAGAIDGADAVRPGRLLTAIAAGGTGDVGYGQAVATFAVWALLLAAIAGWAFRIRDMTA